MQKCRNLTFAFSSQLTLWAVAFFFSGFMVVSYGKKKSTWFWPSFHLLFVISFLHRNFSLVNWVPRYVLLTGDFPLAVMYCTLLFVWETLLREGTVCWSRVRKVSLPNLVSVKLWTFLTYFLLTQILFLRRIVFPNYEYGFMTGTVFIQSSRSASCPPLPFLPQSIVPWFWVVTYEGCGPVSFSDAGTYRIIREENKFDIAFDTCLPPSHFCLLPPLRWEKCSVCCSSPSQRSTHQGYASIHLHGHLSKSLFSRKHCSSLHFSLSPYLWSPLRQKCCPVWFYSHWWEPLAARHFTVLAIQVASVQQVGVEQ